MSFGEISRKYLQFSAMQIAERLQELQALQAFPGNKVDTRAQQARLKTELQHTIFARNDIDRLIHNNALVISGGTLPTGTPLNVDRHTIDMMDRVYGMLLSQMGPALTAGTTPSGSGVHSGAAASVDLGCSATWSSTTRCTSPGATSSGRCAGSKTAASCGAAASSAASAASSTRCRTPPTSWRGSGSWPARVSGWS
jgi:hypothetical protein